MGRAKGALARFTCMACGTVDLTTGGTSNYKCVGCRSENGIDPLGTPKYLAHQAVAKARRDGVLADPRKLACVDCDGAAIEYDHRDYSKPLEVVPVCRGCNLRRGPAITTAAA